MDTSVDRRFRSSGRQAFTLIELLVVISIIALLVGILLPALGKARASAQQMLCATNQKSVQLAAAVYASDFKGWYPVHTATQSNTQPGYGISWDDRLSDYDGRHLTQAEKTAAVPNGHTGGPLESQLRGSQSTHGEYLRCPVDQRQGELAAFGWGPGGWVVKSYVPNGFQGDGAGGVGNNVLRGVIGWYVDGGVPGFFVGASRNEDQITRPSDAITFSEATGETAAASALYASRAQIGSANVWNVLSAENQVTLAATGRIIHGSAGTFNYAFADGHVSAMNVDDTLDGSSGIADVTGSLWDAVRD